MIKINGPVNLQSLQFAGMDSSRQAACGFSRKIRVEQQS